ncbi:SMP-30/gluconolactonase/LRE family protein [Variovorax sp. J31P207]|uniref:SMP-30/gluconolactonase/LRE family protein n=1 Tax=Variovorax sp. J31P207 TaxID=3053510 RepID=UPI0025772B65|nr:SMP-30/gluconolactonase/LRE family protein [Variovorax sp. J31P207]MDM0071425.1 SMP-30/gluconolactonase/LRE family protein [Variovorax sp. J31P207]
MKELAGDLAFPEGPVALDDGSVLVVEVAGQTLKRVCPDGRIQVVAALEGGPNGAALGPDGACWVCNNGGMSWLRDPVHGMRPHGLPEGEPNGFIQRVDLQTGRNEVVYTEVDGRPLNAPNDLVFDRHGGFYFTDFGKVRASQRRRDYGAVYYAKSDGSTIHEVAYPIVSPNGIGLSPDETTLYVADTEPGRLWAFAICAPGQVEKLPWPSPHGGRVLHASGGGTQLVRFDSLAVDEAGNVNVATLIQGGITVVSADGATASRIPLPDPMTTNLCFGGPGMRTAFVTLAGAGKVVAIDWEHAGLRLNFAA